METLKVKMATSIASADWSFTSGQEVELDVELADAWLDCGHAVRIKGEKVDKRKLPEGVSYLGFGFFDVFGQRTSGKDSALEILPTIKALYVPEVGEDDVAENADLSNGGAADAGGDESAS